MRDSIADESYSVKLAKADELRTSNPEQSSDILKSIDESELQNYEKELYQYLTGLNLFINGNVLQAKTVLSQLALSNNNKSIQVRTLNTLLSVYSSSNNWLKALQTVNLLNEHLKTQIDLKKDELENIKLAVLIFYNNIGEYHLAKEMAIELLNASTSTRFRCITSGELLNSQIKTSINSISPADFEKVLAFCRKIYEPIILHVIHGYFAQYHLTLNAPRKAVKILKSNIEAVKNLQYQALIALFYSLLAQSYLDLENYSEAEMYAQLLLDTEEQHHNERAITTVYKVHAEVNEHQNNYEKAFYYYKKYSKAKQLNLDQENAKLLALQKAKLNDAEKNAKIALLDKENTLLKTQALLNNESAQNKRLALALLSMALLMFILWAYKNRKIYLKMRHFAETDGLTGIANRHHFAQQAHSIIKLCKKTDQPVSLVIFDLDYFKKINDTYGHLVGDEALKIAVNAAKSACRKNDIIGRLGGEEFGILLPGCGNHLAIHIADKCRKAIEKSDTSATGHQFTLTASFGVSDSSVCNYEFNKLFAGADKALYQSKDLGRNQVFNYQVNSFAFDI